jgi:hypothetical protein
MKYFIDTEFIEYPCTIELISIGIISEDNKTFYAESNEFEPTEANDFVQLNVFPHLKYDPFDNTIRFGFASWEDEFSIEMLGNKSEIRDNILKFIGKDKPEFWGYYADYDWVVFCWLFGPMVALPHGWPMYCKDLKQLADSLGNPKLPKPKNPHNSLIDAKWIKIGYETLINE